MISEKQIGLMLRQLNEGKRASRIVEWSTFKALVDTAHDRNRLQPILAAALGWFGAVNEARSNLEGATPEQVGAIDAALETLYDAVAAEVQAKLLEAAAAVSVINRNAPNAPGQPLPGLGGPL